MSVIEVSAPRTADTWAHQLLDAVNAGLAYSTGGAIGRAFVTFALPVLDCDFDQLMVDVRGVSFVNTSPQSPLPVLDHRAATQGLAQIQFFVTIARCVPVWDGDNLPTVTALETAAAILNEDVWTTWNQLIAVVANGEIFGARCLGVGLDPPTPLPASGGVGGWVFPVRAQVSGFTPGVA